MLPIAIPAKGLGQAVFPSPFFRLSSEIVSFVTGSFFIDGRYCIRPQTQCSCGMSHNFRSNRTRPRYSSFRITTTTLDIIIPEQSLVLEGGILVDLGAIGSRIKAAGEKKHLTQDDLAALVDLISV